MSGAANARRSADLKYLKTEDDGPFYSVEYASTSRSSCKKCKAKIARDQLRAGIWIKSTLFDGLQCKWYHKDCLLHKVKTKNLYGTADLNGLDYLRWSDQVALREHFQEISGREVDGEAFPRQAIHSITYLSRPLQNRAYWAVRDMLLLRFALSDITAEAASNGLSTKGGESVLLDSVTDGILYGTIPPCPECSGNTLVYKDGAFVCTGSTDWAKCTYTASSVIRNPWRFSETFLGSMFSDWADALLAGTVGEILAVWEEEVNERRAAAAAAEEERLTDAAAAAQARIDDMRDWCGGSLPLAGLVFVVVGKPRLGPVHFSQVVVDYGGRVAPKINSKTTALIVAADNDDLSDAVWKFRALIEQAIERGTPILREDYVDACLVVGGSEGLDMDAFRVQLPSGQGLGGDDNGGDDGDDGVAMAFSLTAKDQVDAATGLGSTHHVAAVDADADEGGQGAVAAGNDLYNVMLNITDVSTGVNSYYAMQVLEPDTARGGSGYHVFLAWGRVGTDVGATSLKGPYTRDAAVAEFTTRYADKTANQWGASPFKKRPGKYVPIRVDRADAEATPDPYVDPAAASRLHPRVANLVAAIFDEAPLAATLTAMHLDADKMPHGQLRRETVDAGYEVLQELAAVVGGGSRRRIACIDLSNRFYTIIPLSFGRSLPPVIETPEMVGEMMRLLEVMRSAATFGEVRRAHHPFAPTMLAPLDAHYVKIGARLGPVPRDADIFASIAAYVDNAQPRDAPFRLSCLDVIQIDRPEERERFEAHPVVAGGGRRLLLWHGTRTSNLVSILSEGLAAAPPHAPASGAHFGRGIYFSDIATYSAGFCHVDVCATDAMADVPNPPGVGYLVLAEVAVGAQLELKAFRPDLDAAAVAAAGKDSAYGCGKWTSDIEAEGVRLSSGEDGEVILPAGTLRRSSHYTSTVPDNEFVVFDADQVSLRYVVKVAFGSAGRR